MFDAEDVGVFRGLDAGRTAHHGHEPTPAGKKILDRRLPDCEPKLLIVFGKLAAKFGTVLEIVDRPASIKALPLTVARYGLQNPLPARPHCGRPDAAESSKSSAGFATGASGCRGQSYRPQCLA